MRAAAGASRPLPTLDIAALIDGRTLSAFQIRVLALVGCLVLLDGLDVQAIGFVAPALLRSWSLEPAALGPIFSAALLGMLAGSMVASVLADRVGRRPVLLGATFFFALCVLATAATRSVSEMVALRFLTGVGMGGVISNAVTLASEYSPAARRASLLLIISCGFTVGAILGGLLAAVLIPRAGWRSVFVVGGLLPLGLAVLLLRELPESLQWLLGRGANRVRIQQWLMRLAPRLTIDSSTVLVRPEIAAASASVFDLFREGRAARSLLLWAVSFANLLNLFFLSNWLPLLASRMGHSGWLAVLIGSSLQAGGIVGAFILGPLMDRFGFYRVLAPAFLIGSAMIATIGRPDLPSAVICAVVLLAGVAIVGGQSGINAIAVSYYPTRLRATGVGWALGIGRAGSIAGPMIAAQLLARHWTSEQMFLTAAIPAGLSALMIWGMARLSARREAAPSAARSGRS